MARFGKGGIGCPSVHISVQRYDIYDWSVVLMAKSRRAQGAFGVQKGAYLKSALQLPAYGDRNDIKFFCKMRRVQQYSVYGIILILIAGGGNVASRIGFALYDQEKIFILSARNQKFRLPGDVAGLTGTLQQ